MCVLPTGTTHIPSPIGGCTNADGYVGYDQHATGQYYTSYTGVYGNWDQCVTSCNNDANCWGFLISTGANGCYPYLSNPTGSGLQGGNSGMTVYEKCPPTGIYFIWMSTKGARMTHPNIHLNYQRPTTGCVGGRSANGVHVDCWPLQMQERQNDQTDRSA